MVFLKNSFNPNLTYVKMIRIDLNLTELWMTKEYFNYKMSGDYYKFSDFYLFNTQVPAMLGRLALTSNFQ